VLLSASIAESLTAVYGDQSLEVKDELSEEMISRETEVLRMLAEGAVNKEIAARLGVSGELLRGSPISLVIALRSCENEAQFSGSPEKSAELDI
jgi:regulatory LuxR family protein